MFYSVMKATILMSKIFDLPGRFVVCCKANKEIDVSYLQCSTILFIFSL